MKITWLHIIAFVSVLLMLITFVVSLGLLKAHDAKFHKTSKADTAIERYAEVVIPTVPDCIHGEATIGVWHVRHFNNAGALLLEAKVDPKDVEIGPQVIRVDYGPGHRIYFSGGVFQMDQITK